ncbi:Crp/Fnr family transcriptional regulator [Siminovitchia sediminis]|uniref:Crp/Fnr family transcriptional regulator n=1 Tax=Siminovitchia sediminis TaxID=1274353 RepID=A0ABW4KGW5_9BACI
MNHEWKPYLIHGQKRTFSKGQMLFLQGEESHGIYFLENGKVNILLLSEDGKERIVEYVIGKALIGETGILGQPYLTSAKCETKSTFYYYPLENIKHLCQQHPKAKEILMKSMSNKVQMLTETMSMTDKPFEQQMAYFLLQLYRKHNTLSVPISQISLAQYIGTSRITIYKIMQKWEKEGIASQGKKKINILDLEKMKTLL